MNFQHGCTVTFHKISGQNLKTMEFSLRCMIIDDDFCDERYIPYNEVEGLLSEINEIDYFNIDELDEDEREICEIFEKEVTKRRLNNEEVEEKIEKRYASKIEKLTQLRRLKALLLNLLDTYIINYTNNTVNEATLVRETIDQILRTYFMNTPILKCGGADNMLKCSSTRFTSIDLSLANHGKRTDFSVISHREKHLLLSLEAKRAGSSISGDFVKLAKELKDSLAVINSSGFTNAHIVGVLMKGLVCSVFVMDHSYDGLYRMVLVNRVYMARDKYGFSRLRSIIITMEISLRCMVIDNSARTVNRPSDTDEVNLPQNMISLHTPIATDRIKKLDLKLDDPMVRRARRKPTFERE